MNLKPVVSILGFLVFGTGVAMLFPIPFSLFYGDDDVLAFVFASIASIAVGLVFWLGYRSRDREEDILHVKEGYLVVTFGWFFCSLFGSLPLLLSGTSPSFTDAFFEIVSGFTTTGASVIDDVEKLPHGILFWRSMTQWLGGMGIIVLSLAILPLLGVGGMQLFKAEVVGPTKDKLAPRIAETARLLWGVYLIISGAETILLLFGGMSLFDALCHMFATVATGGFSTRNHSIGQFESSYIEWVVTIFMFLAGTNFALHLRALRGNLTGYRKNNEFVFYSAILLVGIVVLATLNIMGEVADAPTSVRLAAFQVVSITTTTGFNTANYQTWLPSSQVIIFFLMFFGGCAGSTGGSIKHIRLLLLLRTGINELKKLIHPKAVLVVRHNGHAVPQEILINIVGFVVLYIALFLLCSILMSLVGLDFITATSAVAATLGNVGPGLGSIGPWETYAQLPLLGKWISIACMLLGRLELFTVLVIFSAAFWRK
ncbi:MAG: TrkH family potassium uptake protein [Bacteroidota bacterium]